MNPDEQMQDSSTDPVEQERAGQEGVVESNELTTENDKTEVVETTPEPVTAADEHADPKLDAALPHKHHLHFKQLVLVALGLVIVAAVAVAYLLMNKDEQPAQNSVNTQQENKELSLGAALALVEGTVQISQDGENWTDAEGGESLTELDYIRTGENGRAVVLVDDGSAVRLDKNATIYLSDTDPKNVNVMLVSGQVYSRVVTNDSRSFSVTTEREQFTALGTAFKTSVGGDSDSVQVYHSKVKVGSEETTVDEGNAYDTASKQKQAIDLAALQSDEFIQWNKQQDEKSEDFKDKLGVLALPVEEKEEPKPAPKPTTTQSSGITLSVSEVDGGLNFSWKTNGVDTSNGFKLVRSKNDSTPTYKEDEAVYVSSGNNSYSLYLKDGKTYYFRLCAYRPDSSAGCDSYSNAVQATAPYVAPEQVQSGAVNLSITGDKLSWAFAGTAPYGFKVLMSTSQNPTYENKIGYTDGTEYTLPSKPAGTYYVKVCKYYEGTCVDLSNQVTYTVN